MFVYEDNQKKDWSKYSLILPSVSVGNVAQLAVDLFLSTLDFLKVGYFYDDSLYALVGSDPFNQTGKTCNIVTGFEIYEDRGRRLVLIQQRVPIVKSKRREFCHKLQSWMKQKQFEKIVLLSSSFAHERNDSQLLSRAPFRYVSTSTLVTQISFDQLGWKKLERRADMLSSELLIPGGGITKMLYEICENEGIPLIALVMFCSEGDNIPDALSLASYLNNWLKVVPPNSASTANPHEAWKIPPSWRLMFGSAPPFSLY